MSNSVGDTAAVSNTLEHVECFNYVSLDVPTARAVRVSTERIRQLVKRSLDDVVEIGAELISVKQTLPHGQFRPWLHSEFGWKERSARNLMSVAQRFKSASIADLDLDPTAAYLLAAPSMPERARTLALERAESGEHITYAAAQDIIDETKNKHKNNQPSRHCERARRAIKALGRLKRQWPRGNAQELALLLGEFANSLEDAS